ncbi:MAG: DALR domain-containing protein, partial [Chitinophagaceae bacterium]
ITIAGRKMGKSYNNVIKLTEMFSGNHPLLEQAYSPMTIRFFILQTHYRSTLDFSNEALQAAEKGLKRLMDAYEWLQALKPGSAVGTVSKVDGENKVDDAGTNPLIGLSLGANASGTDKELEDKVLRLLGAFEEFINDDFSTAKVLANMFELVPVINGMKDGLIAVGALRKETVQLLKDKLKSYVEDIFGLKSEELAGAEKLKGAMKVLIDLRRQARAKKDWVTSDAIRNQLAEIGIMLKDEKGGAMSWNML